MRARGLGKRTVLKTGLPEDAVSDCARVTLCGRTSLLMEGQRGVVEMSGKRIRLRTADGILSVCGTGLMLQELSSDAAMIRGERIEGVTYGRPDGGGGAL